MNCFWHILRRTEDIYFRVDRWLKTILGFLNILHLIQNNSSFNLRNGLLSFLLFTFGYI